MADEKVVIELVLDDKDFKKVANAIPNKFKETGKKSGQDFSSGLKSGLKSFGRSLTTPLRAIKSEFLALGTAIAGGFLFKKAIDEAKKLENSLIGLQTVTSSFGGNVDSVTETAKALASDGLIPLSDVTDSLKNLLVTFDGDMQKSVDTFKSFRNAAAFGRQGTLELGEAIRGASEGLKNDISNKVDNAGVTRNLSLMQKDYAKELGKSVASLTEAEKSQAKYLGVQKESLKFGGDYNKLLNTFSGAQSKVAGSTRFLLAELGSIVTQSPLVVKLLNDVADSIQGMTKNVKIFSSQGGLKTLLVGFVEIGRVINDYFIRPLEFVLDVLDIIQKSFQVFFQTIIAGFAKLGGVVASALSIIGVDNPVITALKDFEEISFDLLNEQIDGFVRKSEDAFGMNAAENINAFFDNMLLKINETTPALSTLGTKIDEIAKEGSKGFKFFADSVTIDAKKLSSVVKSTLAKGVAGAFESFGRALVTGEDIVGSFTAQIVSMFGDLAIQVGTMVIGWSLAMDGLKAAVGGPGVVGVAYGAALVAIGGALKAFGGSFGSSTNAPSGGGNSGANPVVTEDVNSEPEERADQAPAIQVNIKGDVLDSTETGMRVVDIINKAYDQEGVVINRGAIA